MRYILFCYLIAISFTSAFAIHKWLPLPMMIGIILGLMVVFYCIKAFKVRNIYLGIFEVNLFLFLFTLVVSLLLATFNNYFEMKMILHFTSYVGTIIVYYFITYVSIKEFKIGDNVFKYIYIGVIITSLMGIFEFGMKNIVHLDIDAYIPRYEVVNYDALYNGAFQRVRAFTEESGHLALYLEIFAPIALWYTYYRSKMKFLWTLLIVIMCLAFTLSAAALVIVIAAIVLTYTIYMFSKKRIGSILNYAVLLIMVYISLVLMKDNEFLAPIVEKLTFKNVSSSQDRLNRWGTAIDLFKEKPLLGWGPGINTVKTDSGFTNYYLELLTQGGIILLLIWCVLLIILLWTCLRIKSSIKYVFIFSLISGSLHYMVISNYWYPWIWILFVLINLQYRKERRYLLESKEVV
ncbi:O-antigen ligase family protein [Bacillus luti]|uniref:O-antigen ligase family protein n=1 Tax=Bacillus luti TaxID=2026191 RepID=UPI0037731CA7